ncbi:MAG: ABC transporter ATP-binding protein [Bosea sp. 32-68-6]|nr:MAG: ABC transporter ATP-binding protein [Bosea sp. 32-68-6]
MTVSATPDAPLLAIEDLHVTFSTRRGLVEAVRGVSFSVAAGETLGVVGESGSGKSVTAFAVTRLLDASGRVSQGRIRFAGEDITAASSKQLRRLHGAAISMIFQNPRGALNPIRTVGQQIADAIMAHESISAGEGRARALELLKAVLIRDPEKRLDAYPHELSGGMCQRVMIAMAIACAPKLLIADEPTTGLDVTTQKTVMDLLARITAERGMAMILITHDLGLASRYCQRVCVMEQGKVVEEAQPLSLFSAPQHPYTKRLVAASPTATSTIADLAPEALSPSTVSLSPHPEEAAPAAVSKDGSVVSQPPGASFETKPAASPQDEGSAKKPAPGTPLLLEVQNLVKRYDRGVVAVNDVSFTIRAGESLGLVGESGSGKSTISRLVCRLIDASEGEILFDGQAIGTLPARDFHRSPLRKDIQIALTARVSECAERAGLPSGLLERFPHQLSGGQKARVGIARAIACRPRLLILDEPTAALDVSVQAVILQLLDRLRREDDLALLFVSHDLNVVRMMCERTVVMQNGAIVEQGESLALFAAPQTDYARTLLEAVLHLGGPTVR